MGVSKVAMEVVGWLTFSVLFNVLNTIVFGTLYPEVLSEIAPKDYYLTAYSTVTTLTTISSAIILPFLGCLVDKLKIVKETMIFTQYAGIICTIGIVILDFLPDTSFTNPNEITWIHLSLNMLCYIFAMFFLRTAVMCNNSLLVCFDKEKLTKLSLSGNFLGFAVNLVGLSFLLYWPNKWFFQETFWEITVPNWWTLFFTFFVIFISPLTFLSPTGKAVGDYENENKEVDHHHLDHLSLKEKIKNSNLVKELSTVLGSMRATIVLGKSDAAYKSSWIFLFSYLFYSVCGTVVTLYIGPLILELYDDQTQDDLVIINLWYKVFMLIGVLFGLFYSYSLPYLLNKTNNNNSNNDQQHTSNQKKQQIEIYTLFFQTFIFLIQSASIFIALINGVEKKVFEYLCYSVGFMYSWNMSVSRGLFGGLVPVEKKSEFMGWYSSFTYLAIAGVGLFDLLLDYFQSPPEILFTIVFFWTIPSFFFLFYLIRFQRNRND